MGQIVKDNKYFILAYFFFILVIGILILTTEKGDFLLLWNEHHSNFQTGLFKILTRIGEASAFLVVVLVYLFFSFKKALVVAVSGLISLPVVQLLKYLFSQPRPMKYFDNMGFSQLFERLDGVDWLTGSNSFPSGHSTAAFALMTALSLCMTNKKWSFIWISLAIVGGMSRIYLRHHFLEDVLFGSVLGVFIAFMVFRMFEAKNIIIRGKLSLID